MIDYKVRLLAIPVSQEAAYKPDPAKMEVNLENAFKSCPDTSPLLSAPVSSEIAVEEISHHTITIPEPHGCRICDPDDGDENGEGLVELGCQCKGGLSRMHRTCFLEWFGIRMLLRDNFKCEVCNSILPFKTRMVVTEAVGDHANGGRRILLKGLKRHLGLGAFASTERAANHDELVQVLVAQRQLETEAAIDVEMPAQGDRAEYQPVPFWRTLVLVLWITGSCTMGVTSFMYVASLLVG